MEEVTIKLTIQEIDYLAHEFAVKRSHYLKNSGSADIERRRILEEGIIKNIYNKMVLEEQTWEDKTKGWAKMEFRTKAEIMFADLGYIKANKYGYDKNLMNIVYTKDDEDQIIFYIDEKDFIIFDDKSISTEELKAINEQCKELGWL